MKNILITISILSLIILSACEKHERIRPSGHIVSETYNFNSITGIETSGETVVIINQVEANEANTCVVDVDENVLPHLVVRQSGNGTIHVYCENVSFIGRHPNITIYLTVHDLRKVSLSGASECQIFNTGNLSDSVMLFDNLEFELSGSSKCFVDNIDAHEIDVELNGASELTLSGWCNKLKLDLSGASEAYDYEMFCNHLDAELSGASKARFTALETLSVELSGGSTLRYDGDPRIIHSDISGGSSLKRR